MSRLFVSAIEIQFGGQALQLLPGRAVYCAPQRTLFIADPHFGKSATFRRFGIPAPDETITDLARLDRLLASTAASRLVVLGDFFHAFHGRSTSTLEHLAAWRRDWAGLEIILVRGNHDRQAGDPPGNWNFRAVAEPLSLPPFSCCHFPCESSDQFVISGHVHPGIALRDRNGASLRAACFVVGPRRMILPAFGTFTGLGHYEKLPAERLYAVNEEQVIGL